MGEHVRDVQEPNGDLIDVLYFCSGGCWSDSFAVGRIGPVSESVTEGGASPCASSEVEYIVHCAECGVRMNGPNPPTVVNLVERHPLGFFGMAVPVADDFINID